ncbi:MAG: ribosomal protein L11 methyltransferase [Parasphingorhabdus sp.]
MSQPVQSWQQLRLELPGELIDAASDLLETLGALSLTTSQSAGEDHFDLAAPTLRNWQSTRICALFDGQFNVESVVQEIQHIFPQYVNNLEIERFDDQDWERVWLERFQPFQVGQNLWICPSWCNPPDNQAMNLILDPGLAFGTGSHATTSMCLQLIASLPLRDSRIVDYGCGSGILAIAAALCGARQVIANDIDPLALQATVSNAEINHVSHIVETCQPASSRIHLTDSNGTCDLVLANILADALIDLAADISSLVKPNGQLLLSGILAHQADRVRAAYPRFKFELTLREDWCLLNGTARP